MIRKLGETQKDVGYHRPNDKWIEVPVATVMEDGETKTVMTRKRSLRSKRRIFTLACTAFTIGTLIILFNSPYKKEFLVPGGLSSNHAQILAGQGSDRCAACHADSDASLTSWISSTISLGHKAGLSQVELCMKCHDKSLASQYATNPHNVAPKLLSEMTSKTTAVSFDAGMVFNPPVHGNEIACSACHREHHGSNHNLAAMTDSQCQSCHKNNFHSFAIDHPEFVDYPLKQRSAIAFDHATHSGKHFPASNSKFNCSQCHIDDDFQNVKKLASFEQSCASCHGQQILESSKAGLALISLPMIDTNAIEDNKLKVGSWPLAGTGDFDGVIPPVMRELLMSDSRASEILSRRGNEFEFGDFDPDDADDVKEAVELVWAIKRLLYDLALNGASAVRTRLETSTGLAVEEDELRSMLTGLDEVVFQNAVRRWLPNLSVEISLMKMNVTDASETQGWRLKEIALKQETVSWWPSDESLYLKLDNEEELAANPLVGLVKPMGSIGDDDVISPLLQPPADAAAAEKDPDVSEDLNVRAETAEPQEAEQLSIKTDLTAPSDDSELLAINPLQQLEKTGQVDPAPTALDLAGDQQPHGPKEKSKVVDSSQTLIQGFDSRTPFANSVDSTKESTYRSGWYRNDQTFNISYRPSGHSDDCLESWIEFATRSTRQSKPTAGNLFEKLMAPTSVGMCRSCHTVDQSVGQASESLMVNWSPRYRDPSLRSFTRFAHGPHTVQPMLNDCSHCHSLDLESSNKDTFLHSDSTVKASNFHPMKVSNCSSCHGENKTSSGCTQCHNYHVGSRVTGTN